MINNTKKNTKKHSLTLKKLKYIDTDESLKHQTEFFDILARMHE